MRRNALGLARTVIESGFDLNLEQLIIQGYLHADRCARVTAWKKKLLQFDKESAEFTFEHYGYNSDPINARGPDGMVDADLDARKPSPGQVHELFDFILDRLRGYYADKSVPATHFNAVAALFSVAPEGAPTALGVGAHLGATHASLYDFDRRIDAIGIFATLPEAEALAAANKRIRNILRKVEGEIPGEIDTTLLREPAEEALAEAVEAAIGDTGDALHRHDYVAVLARLARLRPQVDAFFDGVMVNADDPQLRANRLALLKKLGDRLGSVAAIEHLSS